MASAAGRQLISSLCTNTTELPLWPSSTNRLSIIKRKNNITNWKKVKPSITVAESSGQYSRFITIPRATQGNANKDDDNDNDEDGISLGTMKLPPNTDLATFGTLLFQWANSLCQGAYLPLPLPLKVDKIAGGARLGFITIADGGETEVLTYIDCIVIPATTSDVSSVPIFRAIRKGALKDKSPPGEPRIMRSLQGALLKSVEIARV